MNPCEGERGTRCRQSDATARSGGSRSDFRPKAKVVGAYSKMNFLGFSGIPFTRTS